MYASKESLQIAQRRLANQLISRPGFHQAGDVVAWLGAVQAQDFLGALWAIGLRMGSVEAEVEQAIAVKSILRTWMMRGTLHFVAAQDTRWMLELLANPSRASSASRLRELELDDAVISRCKDLMSAALIGGKQLTREEMFRSLQAAHISTAGQRGIHILHWLAQDRLICFGARSGRQQTFTLLEEWLPPGVYGSGPGTKDEALAELARRYFTGHGPATLLDFAWWSGLPVSQARAGLEMARSSLEQEAREGKTYWFSASVPEIAGQPSPSAFLLPAFDEYLVGYADRQAVLDPEFVKKINAGGGILNPSIVIDGKVVGLWKRALKGRAVVITPTWFTPPGESETEAFARAAHRYGAYLNLPVALEQGST